MFCTLYINSCSPVDSELSQSSATCIGAVGPFDNIQKGLSLLKFEFITNLQLHPGSLLVIGVGPEVLTCWVTCRIIGLSLEGVILASRLELLTQCAPACNVAGLDGCSFLAVLGP